MSDTLLHLARLSLAFGRVDRATLHEDGVTPESDTTHTVMLGLLALAIEWRHPELRLNRGTLALLALVHDLPEVYAGDTNTAGGLSDAQKADKAAREAAALARLRTEIPGIIPRAVEYYEAQHTPEARFLRYLDKITPKLTHALNGNAAIRRAGHSVEWLRERHRTQGAELAAKYPEFAGVLGPLFDVACAASEAALVAPSPLTACPHCTWAGEQSGRPTCAIGWSVACLPDMFERLTAWKRDNLGADGRPKPGATDCPSFSPEVPRG